MKILYLIMNIKSHIFLPKTQKKYADLSKKKGSKKFMIKLKNELDYELIIYKIV